MNHTRLCTVCQEEYPITTEYFYRKKGSKYGITSQCKNCINHSRKIIYKKNKKHIIKQNKTYYQNNKKNKQLYNKNYYQYNKSRHQTLMKQRYDQKKSTILKQNKIYRQKNQQKIAKQKLQYIKRRLANDISYRLKCNLRRRISSALHKNLKSARTMDLIGCSIEQLWIHLEKQFTEGMNRGNHGRCGWHIDHIIPCASFDLTDPKQQKQCFHYTNLQPLWAADNIRKSDKVLDNEQ